MTSTSLIRFLCNSHFHIVYVIGRRRTFLVHFSKNRNGNQIAKFPYNVDFRSCAMLLDRNPFKRKNKGAVLKVGSIKLLLQREYSRQVSFSCVRFRRVVFWRSVSPTSVVRRSGMAYRENKFGVTVVCGVHSVIRGYSFVVVELANVGVGVHH